MAIEAIIFDCDGTLVDSLPLATQVLVEYLDSLGIAVSVSDAMDRFGSGRLSDAIAEFERERGYRLPREFASELRRRFEGAVRRRLRPIDGALDLVKSLRIPIAVASNGPLPQTLLSLEVTGLLEYFSTNVFSAYDVGSWKPDPGLFLHAAGALGAAPSRCVVVEDAVVGVDAGLAAGMTVFALCNYPSRSDRVCKVRSLADVGERLAPIVR